MKTNNARWKCYAILLLLLLAGYVAKADTTYTQEQARLLVQLKQAHEQKIIIQEQLITELKAENARLSKNEYPTETQQTILTIAGGIALVLCAYGLFVKQ